MKTSFKTVFLSGAALFAGVAMAVPTVTVTRAQQRYPWNGLVDIDYTVSGLTGAAGDYLLDFSATVTEKGGARTCALSNFVSYAACDLPTAEGTHRVTWRANADGLVAPASAVTVSARLIYDPITDREADYIIVDISAGSVASAEYPLRFVRGAAISSASFCTDLYRTDRLVLKRVTKGSFWMGEGNVSSGSNRHYVSLTNDFFLGIFPATQRQTFLVCGYETTSYRFVNPTSAVCVATANWNEGVGSATSFAANLVARSRYHGERVTGFTLPTESQWEYACRAGTETTYYWGSDSAEDADKYMWYVSNAQSLMHPPGEKLPNAWGFYDMCGHVLEYCLDHYGDYPPGTPEEPAVDPRGTTGDTYPLRGGAWLNPVSSCTSGSRASGAPTGIGNCDYNGFRIALEH